MDTGIGPDGLPPIFDGSGWVSSDGRHRWNGTAWTPVARASLAASPWLIRIGLALMLFALAAFAVYTVVSSQGEFAAGYYVGLFVFFGLTIWIFRAPGNWGWIGILVRMAMGGLMLLRIIGLLRNPPPL